MTDIVDLLSTHYDAKHGVFNLRPVVDHLMREDDPFTAAFIALRTADPQWRASILEAMRALAVAGRCTDEGANRLLEVTESIAKNNDADELYKTVNALAGSSQTIPALVRYMGRLLSQNPLGSAERYLIFYIVGMLLSHKAWLRQDAATFGRFRDFFYTSLPAAATTEESHTLRSQFDELVEKWSEFFGVATSSVPRKIVNLRVGEALVGDGNEVAHIDLLMGPRGSVAETAFVNCLTNQKDRFTSLLAIVAPNLMVKPATVMFNKVTIKSTKQVIQLFGPAQYAVARAVADSVAEGVVPLIEADDLFICVGVFIHWEAMDDKKIQEFNYRATKEAIAHAVRGEPTAAEVVTKKDRQKHPFAA